MKVVMSFLIIAAVMFVITPAVMGQAGEKLRKDAYVAPTQTEAPTLEEQMQKIKNPTSWMSWGFDQRIRPVYTNNIVLLDKNASGHERIFNRFRSRLWSKFTPAEDIEINTRLVWEWRIWCNSNSPGPLRNPSSIEWDEAIFDQLNAKFKNLFEMPMDIQVGRQDLIFGNGWLVLDGTPLDGSRTIYFDAARMTYRYEESKSTLDLVYIDQSASQDRWIDPINDQDRAVMEQDERGAILYLTNKAIENVQIDGYYIWKHDIFPDVFADNYPASWSRESDLHTFGARAAGKIDDNWGYRAEFAQQLGRQKNFGGEGQSVCAFGFNGRLNYKFNDAWNNEIHTGYEYLSGDDPGTESTDEGFDPLWARWPQWSELYIYTYSAETRIAETTNLHRINVGWDADPCEKIHLCNEYNAVFADENTMKGSAGFSNGGSFRGHLLATKLIYKFSPHISGHLWGEYFFPGNYYTNDRNDAAVFLRYELMITF
jgi:hypothetical protein